MAIEKLESFKVKKETIPFTQLANKVLQSLSDLEILGLWCYLASLPPHWNIVYEQIQKHFGIGRHKREKLFANLKKLGLIEYVAERNDEGFFLDHVIKVKCGIDFDIRLYSATPPISGGVVSTPPETGAPDNRGTRKSAPINKQTTINKEKARKGFHPERQESLSKYADPKTQSTAFGYEPETDEERKRKALAVLADYQQSRKGNNNGNLS